jgi:hypothetical protein
MKLAILAGAAALALSLGACASDPSNGNPTFLGVDFNFGAKANAQLVAVANKIDAGLPIVLQDAAALCKVGAKIAPAANAVIGTLPTSAQQKTAGVVAAVNAAIASPTCTDTSGDVLQEVVDLANTIAQIKAATQGKVTATSAASN